MSWSAALNVIGVLWCLWLVYFLVRLARWERSADRLLRELRQGLEPELDPDGSGLRRFRRATSLKADARARARRNRARKARRR